MARSKEDIRKIENQEWLNSLQWIIDNESPERAQELLELLRESARQAGIDQKAGEALISDYDNTIHSSDEQEYPGDEEIENNIYKAIRWNAMALVVKANLKNDGIGGHISTYSSASTLWEVGLNHFFHGYNADDGLPDLVYFQGHASPGLYARSFLEHRFDEETLEHFRLEIQHDNGLSSYPHPRLMPNYWRFPTVSMGLAPLQAIYQARYLKYLKNRGLIDAEARKQQVWAFLGDGEMDEPESTGALSIARREKLDNLNFIVNCNLQRLDGPVRGNNQVISELEGIFKGAGWTVIKVIWGRGWDRILERDNEGKLAEKFPSMTDGEMQHLATYKPDDWREKFFTDDLASLIDGLDDGELEKLWRGGHDAVKVFNAYKKAVENTDGPTVILAQTVKGFQQGKAGEASNVTHQTKKFKEDDIKAFRDRLDVPVKDEELGDIPFYRFEEDSEEFQYLKKRRDQLGGWLPERQSLAKDFEMPEDKIFGEFNEGSGDDAVPTTGVFVKILSKLLKDKKVKDKVVPIIPDESRTFGMDPLFRQVGIYAAEGQKYEPVDKDSMLYYKEAKNGVILEEGITEAGSMASFIAAGTNHISQPFYQIPFFVFYSMFGFQRIGDLIWAAGDARTKGFMMGGISGRTSLSGEGLQHTDGNSQFFALAYPHVQAYDPAFAYELAAIVKDGLKRMYVDDEDVFYYITISNQEMKMPKRPADVEIEILKGLYRFSKSRKRKNKDKKVNLLGSGAIMAEVLQAAGLLEDEFDIPADIWSVTSYKNLYENARDTDRENALNATKTKSYLKKQLGGEAEGELFIAASDWVKALPLSIAKWVPGQYAVLGTDGFGRSDTEEAMRHFFAVDAKHIAYQALVELWRSDKLEKNVLKKFRKEYKIQAVEENPAAH